MARRFRVVEVVSLRDAVEASLEWELAFEHLHDDLPPRGHRRRVWTMQSSLIHRLEDRRFHHCSGGSHPRQWGRHIPRHRPNEILHG